MDNSVVSPRHIISEFLFIYLFIHSFIYLSIYSSREALIREAFEKADKNGDGVLDIAEINCVFRALKHSLNPDELFRIMNHMDKDKTGTINYNEFLRYFLKESGYFDD